MRGKEVRGGWIGLKRRNVREGSKGRDKKKLLNPNEINCGKRNIYHGVDL